MKQLNARAASRHQPTRVQVILAAAWLILSLAIGGALAADPVSGDAAAAPVTDTARP
jgi:hypothetical protein